MNKGNRKIILPVIIEQDVNGGYIANIPSLRGCHTEADTLEGLYKNLEEVVSLCMEMEEEGFKDVILKNTLVSMQPMEFNY